MTKWMSIVLILVGVSSLAAAGQALQFVETEYYIVALGEVATTPEALVAEAESEGITTIVYGDAGIEVTRNGGATDATPDEAAEDARVLIVDSGRFLLRVEEAAYVYAVRASETGYELVIGPATDLSATATLGEILTALQELGVVGTDVSLEYTAYEREVLKGPASPEGAALESTLYGLVVAEDWDAYAAAHGMTMVGLRVEVVAEKLPGEVIPEAYVPYLVTETEQLAKLLLPIDRIVPLAKASAVGFVRLPYQPAVP
jgi:hypothetical protein